MDVLLIVNVALDFVLIAAAASTAYLIMGYGGISGKAFNIIAWGTIFVGVANLLSSLFVFWVDLDVNEVGLIQRLAVLAGMLFVVIGFRTLFRSE